MFINRPMKWQLSFLVALLLLLVPAGRGYTVYAAAEDQVGTMSGECSALGGGTFTLQSDGTVMREHKTPHFTASGALERH